MGRRWEWTKGERQGRWNGVSGRQEKVGGENNRRKGGCWSGEEWYWTEMRGNRAIMVLQVDHGNRWKVLTMQTT